MRALPLLVALTLTSNAFADVISGDMQLRDAIYLYGQEFRANSLKSIVGEKCDVFQLVLDVESGYADISYAQSSSISDALSNRTTYGDRIFDWQAMFAYAMYQAQNTKTFSFGDRNYGSTGFRTGSGTVFGYCYSTQAGARVYLNEKDKCLMTFSDGHTEPISSCMPITYNTTLFPSKFTDALLNGKTFYDVYWGNGKPVIERIVFNNGVLTMTGILNSTDSGSSAYSIDSNGNLSLAAVPGGSTKIVCGSNTQAIKVHNYDNGVFQDADLVFSDLTAAQNYAALMTGPVPPCKGPQ